MTSLPRHQEIQRVKSRLERRGFPRLQMFLLVGLTGLSGLVTSYALLHLGLETMWSRYLASFGIAYLVFLFLLWVWLRSRADGFGDIPDLSGSNTASSSPDNATLRLPSHDGEFGGGGASGSYDSLVADISDSAGTSPVSNALSSVGEAEEFAIPLAAILFFVILLFSTFFVIYSAPVLFAELIVDSMLAASLYRRLRGLESRHWLETAIRRTAGPFALTAAVISAGGGIMSQYVPEARSLGEFITHTSIERGYKLMNEGRKEEAIQAFEHSVREHPQDPLAWLGLAGTLSASGKGWEAIEAYTSAISLLEKNESKPESNDSATSGSAGKPVVTYRNQTLVFPYGMKSWLYLQRGMAYAAVAAIGTRVREQGFSGAIADFEKAILLAPGYEEAIYQKNLLLQRISLLSEQRDTAVALYILPTDDIPVEYAADLARFLTLETGIRTRASPSVFSGTIQPFSGTHQYPAEEYLALGIHAGRQLGNTDWQTYFIVLASRDINFSSRTQNFVFSSHAPADRVSVLSVARLLPGIGRLRIPVTGSWRIFDTVRDTRVRKMLMRISGEMKLGWQRNNIPSDLMYTPISSVSDIDRMELPGILTGTGKSSSLPWSQEESGKTHEW